MQSLTEIQNLENYLGYNQSGYYFCNYRGTQLNSVFQPILDKIGNTIGFEALLRITCKNGQSVRPDLFFNAPNIPTSDKLNVEALSRAVHIYNFSQSSHSSSTLFLNMLPEASQQCAENIHVHTQLMGLLKNSKIDTGNVVMELLETEISSNMRLSRATQCLNKTGFSIAIDDFGVKGSNEQRANAVNPDILKIDRSLLNQYFSGFKKPLYHAIDLAKKLNAKTIIEGIETKTQFDEMRDLGIDMYQGFYLATPQTLPPKSVELTA